MTTEIVTDGVDQLLRSIDDVLDDLEQLEPVHSAAADEVLGYVRPPVRTGRLASTVRAEVDALGFRITAGGTEAPYAPIVHARVPFLDTAAEQREQAVIDVYADHLDHLVDQIQGA